MYRREDFLQKLLDRYQKDKISIFAKKEDYLQKFQDKILYQENSEGYIFKYTSISDRIIGLIESSKINLTHYNKFNDPYDSRFINNDIFSIPISMNNIKYISNKYGINFTRSEKRYCLNKGRKGLSEIIFNKRGIRLNFLTELDLNSNNKIPFQEDLDISCFSSQNNNMLMWSHYASNHKGLCLAYKYNDCKYLYYPVTYCDQPSNSPDEAIIKKGTIWKYENEWRIAITDGLNKILQESGVIDSNSIGGFLCKRVYLGQRFYRYFENYDKEVAEWERSDFEQEKMLAKKLVGLLLKKDIPTYITKANNKKYELYHEKISKSKLEKWKNL